MPHPLDPKQMFDHAVRFQWSEEYMRHKERATTPHHVEMCGDPCLVLSALASELMLKCLLVIEGKQKNEFERLHRLDQLFSKLSQPVQSRIRALWDQQVWTQDSRDFIGFVQTNLAKGDPIPRDFTSALRLGANTFVELRYVYEKKRNINNLIVDLPLILRRVIYEIHPDWKP